MKGDRKEREKKKQKKNTKKTGRGTDSVVHKLQGPIKK